MTLQETIALTLGVGWASGLNLYAAILTLGILGSTGAAQLPPSLELLTHPAVISVAGVMFFFEFFADKIPGLDSTWDAIHTFIRIPAGVILAAQSVGNVDPAVVAAAGLIGGALAASTHATKAGTRVMINTSPEPVTNWIASVTEDLMVISGIWLALSHPWLFLGLLAAFILAMIWFLPILWRGIKGVCRSIASLFGGTPQTPVAKTG